MMTDDQADRQKILIIDDEQAVSDVIRRYLKRSGYICETANNAVQAIEKLEKEDFDLAIIDIMMPDMNGIELLKQIRTMNPHIAVIMMSGMAEVNTAVQALRLGALDYLTKPPDLKTLPSHVHRAIQKRNLYYKQKDLRILLESEVKAKTRELNALFFSTIHALVNLQEAKDAYTNGHSRRVMIYSLLIADVMKLSAEEKHDIRIAGLLHDIGKIGVPESILNKPAALTPEEYKIIQQHPVIGEMAIRPIRRMDKIAKIIRHHHERFDGQGYPDGLAGNDIPLISRIIMVGDTYDAMTSNRPYRRSLPEQFSLGVLKESIGTQFDPEPVKAFLSLKSNPVLFKEKFDALENTMLDDSHRLQNFSFAMNTNSISL